MTICRIEYELQNLRQTVAAHGNLGAHGAQDVVDVVARIDQLDNELKTYRDYKQKLVKYSQLSMEFERCKFWNELKFYASIIAGLILYFGVGMIIINEWSRDWFQWKYLLYWIIGAVGHWILIFLVACGIQRIWLMEYYFRALYRVILCVYFTPIALPYYLYRVFMINRWAKHIQYLNDYIRRLDLRTLVDAVNVV